MKIVVTGGTGFLGRHVVWRCAGEHCEVVFTGRNPVAAHDILHHAAGKVLWLPVDHGTNNAQTALMQAAQGADVVIHCAALSSPWGRWAEFHRANVASTAEVLAACHGLGISRLIHLSTPSLYFGFADRVNIREDAVCPPPANDYVRTKAEAERLIRANPPPQTVILRPRALFGPWDQTLTPRLLRMMAHGSLPLMRGGKALLDLTYIDNAVDAVWLAATRVLPRRLSTYNVSNGEPMALLQLLTLIAGEFGLPLRTRRLPWPLISLLARVLETAALLRGGKEPLFTRYTAGVLAFSQTLDIGALRNELGYVPRVSIEEGLRRHAHWWRQQGTT